MYRAKAHGRARAEVFEPGLRIRASDRLDLKSALRRSVDAGDLTVVYQPIMSLVGGGCLGAEALIRWEHPTRGPIPPTDFVPIAEEAGLIGQIGQQVLAEALEEVRKWRRELPGGDGLWVAVNLSARQLQDNDVIDMLASAIGPDECTPQALHIEITESVLIDEPETCASNLKAIRALGVPISLDDFGTGYSSLSFLRRYPIDTIKVDRSFVRGLGSDAHDSSIVAAVVGLGKAFGLRVLAEGIETTGQLKRLQAMGCDQGQGYLWSPGLPGPAFRSVGNNRLDDDSDAEHVALEMRASSPKAYVGPPSRSNTVCIPPTPVCGGRMPRYSNAGAVPRHRFHLRSRLQSLVLVTPVLLLSPSAYPPPSRPCIVALAAVEAPSVTPRSSPTSGDHSVVVARPSAGMQDTIVATAVLRPRRARHGGQRRRENRTPVKVRPISS